jgi:HD-GYP domain-containing protein (c-di-GMP phosphodiesterase class II)
MPTAWSKQIFPQPLIAAVLMSGTGLLLWHILQVVAPIPAEFSTSTYLLGLTLILVLVCANTITIQLSYNTKTTFGNTAMLLISVLLPPANALVAAIVATFVHLTICKHKRRLYWVDIITDSSRVGLNCFVAAVLHQALVPTGLELIHLGIPALTLLLGDFILMPLVIGPITGQRPTQIMQAVYRDYVLIEGPQYLLAVPIVAMIEHSLSLVPLLIIPLYIIYRVFNKHFHLQDSTRALLEQMADMVDLRDPYTGGHSRRVAEYTTVILKQLQMDGHDVELMITAARIHDIGKVGVPDAILNKPGRLTDEERLLMEQHPVLGANLLLRYPDFARGVAIVRHHHERIDGRGYPDGLRGEEIPFGARVIAVADTWDALTSDRPYRKGMSVERAAAILCEGRGTQWSPELVDALILGLGHAELLEPTNHVATMQHLSRITLASPTV